MTQQKKDTTVPANELVAFQKADFFLELIDAVDKHRESIGEVKTPEEKNQAAEFSAKVSAAMGKHLGILCNVFVVSNKATNAFASMPLLTPASVHSVHYTQRMKGLPELVLGNINVLKMGDKINGLVDLANSKVGGDFSRIPADMTIATGLFKNKSFTNRMVACVILHEAGHIYNQFATLADTLRCAFELAGAFEKLVKADKKEYRIILDYTSKQIGFEDRNAVAVASQCDDALTAYTVYSAQVVGNRYRRNVDPRRMYGQQGHEFSADSFAIRHGAFKETLEVRVAVSGAVYMYNNHFTLMRLGEISLAYIMQMANKQFINLAIASVNVSGVAETAARFILGTALARGVKNIMGTPLKDMIFAKQIRANSNTDHAEALKQDLAELAKSGMATKEQMEDAQNALAYANDIIKAETMTDPLITKFFDAVFHGNMSPTAVKEYSANIANLLSNELFLKAQGLE